MNLIDRARNALNNLCGRNKPAHRRFVMTDQAGTATSHDNAEGYQDIDGPDEVLSPEEFTKEFAVWAAHAPTEELLLMLAGVNTELQARKEHPAQQGAAKVQDQINANSESAKDLAPSGSAALHNAGSKQPPVDNDHVEPGATQFTAAEIAANKPIVAAPVAPAAPAAPVKAWHEDV